MNLPRLTALAALSLTAFACLPAAAQDIKPGLWESTSKTGDDQMAKAMKAMQQQLASMPAAQRKAMEEMMAKNGSGGMKVGDDGSISVKVCMSREMIKDAMFANPQGGNCKHTKSPTVGGTMKFSYTCTNPPQSGEGVVRFNGSDSYTSTFTGKTTVNGQTQTMSMQGTSKYLGPDCGNIKPFNLTPAATAAKAAR